MSNEAEQLQAVIEALETQRQTLGDAVVDVGLDALRARLAAAVAASAGVTQQLKQVGVLFLDVVGSTTLSQHLDPEDISDVMDNALQRATQIVDAHQGKVLQYAGDNVLAVFGADRSREDDTERAVHCGLALLGLGRALGAEVQRACGHTGLDVRVGVHTGGVLLGGGVDCENTIRGITVNIAARMEQTAPPGALRISRDAHTQVRGLFEVEPQEPLLVKGIEEPLVSYLVRRAKPRPFRSVTRGIEGVDTRMIGREAEFEQLQDAFRRLFVQRTLTSVTVIAEAGLGKSRLLLEFESWAKAQSERVVVFDGRATPHTQGQPFGLLRDILARRFRIADDDSVADARRKLEQGIVPLFAPDDGADLSQAHAHLLGHLIGVDHHESRHVRGILDDPRQIRNRAFHAAAQMFRRASAAEGAPVVLQLEDLQWADSESLGFLDYLVEVNRNVALLIVGLGRPSLVERRPDWPGTGNGHMRIDLAPLDGTGSRLLVDELLHKLDRIPAALRELIVGGAEGNPYYMEELVKMLIDKGAIEAGTASWTLHADTLQATHVPATLTGVLQARLDGLPVAERLALQAASVIGQVFWGQALAILDTRAYEVLPMLVRRGLVLPRAQAASDGLSEYTFGHALLHQVTYNTVLKRTRRELHGKLAHWLSRLAGVRAIDFLALTAEHYEHAADNGNAVEYHARAAEHASNRNAHDSVLAQVRKALTLLPSMDETTGLAIRWRLLKVREATLELRGLRQQQRDDLGALEELSERLADDRLRAYAAYRQSVLGMRTADWPACEAKARRGAPLAERVDDRDLQLRCQRLVALALALQGQWPAGQALAQKALLQASALDLLDVQSQCLNTLGFIAGSLQRDPAAALDLAQQTLAIDRQIGNRRGEAISLGSVGEAWLKMGAFAQARSCLEEALRMLRAIGDRVVESDVLRDLSHLALWQGEDARAMSLARLARDTAHSAEATDAEAQALVRLGMAELALGRFETAAEAFEQARALAMAISHRCQHDATAGLARVALAQGAMGTALQHVQSLMATAAMSGSLDDAEDPRMLELTCFQVLAASLDLRASLWLERAHEAVQATARKISDVVLRNSFLTNVPHHREILAASASAR